MSEKQQQMEQPLDKLLDPKTEEMLQKLAEMLQSREQKDGTRDQLSKMQMDNKIPQERT